MFLMGIYDALVLPCNGIITGIQVMLGAHYCNYPTLFYFSGVLPCVGFYGVMAVCALLALDRFLEMCFPKIASKAFSGNRAYFWMLFPICFQIYAGFELLCVFNINVYAMNPDPFFLIHGMENNINMTYQAFIICGEMLVAPVIHALMYYIEFPMFVEVFAHLSWISMHANLMF
uniref:G protein-coupled receptor n=1 Tax=Panagrolaimus davidi TaxID=227884 RepID=A0A914QD94_9BILA